MMISFLDFTRPDLNAVPRVVSLLSPLPVRISGVGGPRTAFRLASSPASTNAANIKAAPGSIYSISGLVAAVTPTVILKLFDTAGVPNPLLDEPLYFFGLTTNGVRRGPFNLTFPYGLDFLTGIGMAMVRGPADFNVQPIGNGQILALNIAYV